MPPNGSFETQSFNPFSVNEDLKDNDQDPGDKFYQTQISSLDTSYYIPNGGQRESGKFPNRRGGGLCIFLLKSLSYKFRDDLAVNSSAIECLRVEVFNKNSKSIVLNLTYRPSNGDPNELENHFKNILLKREITNKELVLVGDFNINVFEFNESKMDQDFVDLMFRHDLIPTVNKPTRVTRNTITAIDHIMTNSVINAEFKTGIIKTNISDHFRIFFIFKCVVDNTEDREEFLFTQNYFSNSIETFKQKLREVNQNEVKQSNNAKESCAKFYFFV